MSEDEQFNQAFGEHTGISTEFIDYITGLKNGVASHLFLYSYDAAELSDLAWRLLGRYIANDSGELEEVHLAHCGIADEKMVTLFSSLSKSKLQELNVDGNELGIEGVRSMVPFLGNSPNLTMIDFSANDNFGTECFELIMQTLNGVSPVESLLFEQCNITNISVLDTYSPSNLQQLNLKRNNIGRVGCITLSNLLRREDANLKWLDLESTSIDDDRIELIATSLEHNTKLEELNLKDNNLSDNGAEMISTSLKNNNKLKQLYLQGNNITDGGYRAFLKLLNDISSIENTYKSNHTLEKLVLPVLNPTSESKIHIITSLLINISSSTAHIAGKKKVIQTQLNNRNRKNICRLLGVEFSSSIFADIEPILLPQIIALIGKITGKVNCTVHSF